MWCRLIELFTRNFNINIPQRHTDKLQVEESSMSVNGPNAPICS